MKKVVFKYLPLVFFYASIVFLVLAFANSLEQTKSATESAVQIAQINKNNYLLNDYTKKS